MRKRRRRRSLSLFFDFTLLSTRLSDTTRYVSTLTRSSRSDISNARAGRRTSQITFWDSATSVCDLVPAIHQRFEKQTSSGREILVVVVVVVVVCGSVSVVLVVVVGATAAATAAATTITWDKSMSAAPLPSKKTFPSSTDAPCLPNYFWFLMSCSLTTIPLLSHTTQSPFAKVTPPKVTGISVCPSLRLMVFIGAGPKV